MDFEDGSEHGPLPVFRAPRHVPHTHAVLPHPAVEDGAAASLGRELVSIHGGGHHDHLDLPTRPLLEGGLDHSKEDVSVDGPLMGLVKDDPVVPREETENHRDECV